MQQVENPSTNNVKGANSANLSGEFSSLLLKAFFHKATFTYKAKGCGPLGVMILQMALQTNRVGALKPFQRLMFRQLGSCHSEQIKKSQLFLLNKKCNKWKKHVIIL